MIRICRKSERGILRGVRSILWNPNAICYNKIPSRNCCSSEEYTPQYKRLEGKVALITGAASGIGAAASRLFAAHGAYVVMADIQEEAGKQLLKELGASAEFVHCDVTKDEDVAAAVKKATSTKGRIDILYSNAGILGGFGPIDEINMKEFQYTMAVNLYGSVLAVKHAASVMKPQKAGSIICTGSSSIILGGLGPHSYTISKAAMVGLVQSAAAELRDYGVRINMVSPHGTVTPLMKSCANVLSPSPLSDKQLLEYARSTSPFPDRILFPIDIARAVLFLASSESGYISGHNLVVDASQTVTTVPATKQMYKADVPLVREAGKTGLD